MSMTTRLSLHLPICLMFSAGLAALTAGVASAFVKVPVLSLKPMICICFVAAGPFFRYVLTRFRALEKIARQMTPRVVRRFERFQSKQAFFERLEELVIGSEEVSVFNLSNPSENDEHLMKYIRSLRRYLKAQDSRMVRYRRISSVSSRDDMLWTLGALARFEGVENLEHLCVDRSVPLACHLSFLLVKRKEGYYVFFFNMLESGGYMDVVMIHDQLMGRFVSRKFNQLWCSAEKEHSSILRDGQIDLDQARELARKYGCEGSREYRRLVRPNWWYF